MFTEFISNGCWVITRHTINVDCFNTFSLVKSFIQYFLYRLPEFVTILFVFFAFLSKIRCFGLPYDFLQLVSVCFIFGGGGIIM